MIAEAVLEAAWLDDPAKGWARCYRQFHEDTLIMEDSEQGHLKGSCAAQCRKCLV